MNKVYAILIGVIAAIAISAALRQSPDAPLPQVQTPPPLVSAESMAPTAYQLDTFGTLTDLVGMTFVSEPMGEDGPFDTQVWDWGVGGTAIRIQHALSDGSYGGDTYVYRNGQGGGLSYVYITNAGFTTEGDMTLESDGSWRALEDVSGHEKWTQVRSTGRRMPDGRLVSSAEYFDGETWSPGHSFTYRIAPAGTQLPALVAPAN